MTIFLRVLCIILMLVLIWGGGYLFDHTFPRGWQYQWYAMPTMMTFTALLVLLIWWLVSLMD